MLHGQKHCVPTSDRTLESPFTEYLGVIVRTHGLDGAVVLGDTVGLTPSISPGDTVGVGYSREHAQPATVRDFKLVSGRITLWLAGVETKEDAENVIDAEALELESGFQRALRDPSADRSLDDDLAPYKKPVAEQIF